MRCNKKYTVDSRYLEVKGTIWNTLRYPYLDISNLQNWGKLNRTTTFHKLVCNLIPAIWGILELEAQVGQKSLTWIGLIMICYIVPWWPSWLSDQIAFSNSESDVVWRVSRLPPWPPSWILELNDLAMLNHNVTLMPPIKFRLNLTYCLGGDVV